MPEWDLRVSETKHLTTIPLSARYYVDILIEELGLHLLPGNPTYNLTDFSASKVLDNHKSVLTSFGIQTTNEELDLPYIYWFRKMHKNPYKHRFIAGSSKCSTKPLSILLAKLLTHIKQSLKYCETSYSRSGVNQMWILKNSKELLEHLQSPNFNHITSIKSFDFSTLQPFLVINLKADSQLSSGILLFTKMGIADTKELARIHGKSAHLAKCSQLFKKSF